MKVVCLKLTCTEFKIEEAKFCEIVEKPDKLKLDNDKYDLMCEILQSLKTELYCIGSCVFMRIIKLLVAFLLNYFLS